MQKSKNKGGNMKRTRLFSILTILLMIFGIRTVSASTYNGRFYEVWDGDSGINVYAEESNRWMDYNSWMVKSTIDNRIYYCIEPALALEGATTGAHDKVTGKSSITSNTLLTSGKYNEVALLTYYGYGYKDDQVDHTSKKWYGITQVMIWRVMRPDLTWTFKTSRNGTPNNSNFASEVAELQKLVDNHTKKPSFSGTNNKVILGKELNLTDTNKVFTGYTLKPNTSNISLTKSGNSLKAKSTTIGKHTITYERKQRTTDEIAVFVSSDYQDVIGLGIVDPISFSFTVEVTGGTVTIQKQDATTNQATPQGDATFEGAIYEVYNLNGNSVGKITTDKTGKGSLTLEFGKYTLKEIKAPTGYALSDEVYEVELTENETSQNVIVKDKVLSGRVKLFKTMGSEEAGYKPENEAIFEVLDKSGKLVEKLITNENGIDIVVLPYGKYFLHQIKGPEGYVLAKDTEINITENKVYEIDIQNHELSKLKFKKTDYSSDKPLPDTLIEIYKDDDILIYSGRTDKNGELILPGLEIGKYYILEKEAPKYYRLNEEKMYFEVVENGKVIKAHMKDERKEGNLKFVKTDESGKKKLEGALIEIIFTETNETVFKNKTDKNGEIKIEGLVAGKYCLYEKEAPVGYKLSKSALCFEIKEDNETIELTMKNQEKKILIPDTKANDFTYLISLGIILLGIGYLIYDKKKH